MNFMPPKLLIFGGSGLVGHSLIEHASDYDIHLTYNKNDPKIENCTSTKIDFISESLKIHQIIRNVNPDHVVHTVAYPSIDFCEKNLDMAETLHVKAVQEISDTCKDLKIKLISFSTDAVFDGTYNGKYTESDSPNPLGHYGRTKLEGENVILNSSNDNVVLRTTVVYGWQKQSRFTNWVMDSIKNHQEVTAFVDQFNTPTLSDDLAQSVLKIIDKKINGLFHASGKTCLSRYDFAMKLATKFNLGTKFISKVKSSDMNQVGPRPKNGCMDSSKLEKTINFQFCNTDEGINFIYKNLLNR